MSEATPTPSEATPTPSMGPTSGLVYGDVPNRIIAYILDILIIVLITAVMMAVLGSFLSGLIGSIVFTLIALAINGAYFVYCWTVRRATLGMQVLSLQIGTAPGGTTITQDQAIRRWLALGAAFSIAQVLATALGALGSLIGLAAFAWVIFLLYTTAKSPTKQGWHDVFANTMIVKVAKTVG